MISVIIPVYNEGATIRKVIQRIRQCPYTIEIIVVDDNSQDNTVEQARREEVRVITSTLRGKGTSMREGLLAAQYDIIIYLDGDIITYPKNVIELLARPILESEADFVKSFFTRQAGRVTQLVAKPLLGIFFPELEEFQQPLSGMIAARKTLLEQVHFENDYGVDIGILIDMHNLGARITEVNIGHIENNMQTLEALGKMARQVSRTILKKAENLPTGNLENLSNIQVIQDKMDAAIQESIQQLDKCILFDINTLLTASFQLYAATFFNLEEKLLQLRNTVTDPEERIRAEAALFAGRTVPELQGVADYIDLVPDAREVIRKLQRKGYHCGMITNEYDVVAHHIRNKLGLDFCFCNQLVFHNGIASGEMKIPGYFLREEAGAQQYDPVHALQYLSETYHIPVQNIIYVGKQPEDIPLLQASGIGVAAYLAHPAVQAVADKVIQRPSLKPILDIALHRSELQEDQKRSKRQVFVTGIAIGLATWGAWQLVKKLQRFA